MNDLNQIIILLKDGITAIFYIIAGAVAILTYRQAKKSLFQPIKTEIFKKQLDLLNDLYGIFGGKIETKLSEDYGYQLLIFANAQKMYDEYAKLFFDVNANPENRLYSSKLCPGGRIKYDHSKQPPQFPTGIVEPEPPKPNVDPNVKAAQWQNYEHDMIVLPAAFMSLEERLRILRDSPLTPTQIKSLLTAYIALNQENADLLRQTLVAIAKELPAKYPNREQLAKGEYMWISNRFIAVAQKLQPIAEEITKYMNDYYDVESLFKP